MTIESRLETLQEQLNTVCELLQISINSLNTKKAVARFLNKSEKTIDNYIKNKTFQDGKHYFINEKNRVEFLPFGIVSFKKNPNHRMIIEEKKEEVDPLILSETSSKILKGIL